MGGSLPPWKCAEPNPVITLLFLAGFGKRTRFESMPGHCKKRRKNILPPLSSSVAMAERTNKFWAEILECTSPVCDRRRFVCVCKCVCVVCVYARLNIKKIHALCLLTLILWFFVTLILSIDKKKKKLSLWDWIPCRTCFKGQPDSAARRGAALRSRRVRPIGTATQTGASER